MLAVVVAVVVVVRCCCGCYRCWYCGDHWYTPMVERDVVISHRVIPRHHAHFCPKPSLLLPEPSGDSVSRDRRPQMWYGEGFLFTMCQSFQGVLRDSSQLIGERPLDERRLPALLPDSFLLACSPNSSQLPPRALDKRGKIYTNMARQWFSVCALFKEIIVCPSKFVFPSIFFPLPTPFPLHTPLPRLAPTLLNSPRPTLLYPAQRRPVPPSSAVPLPPPRLIKLRPSQREK